jgi:hypothetical protein
MKITSHGKYLTWACVMVLAVSCCAAPLCNPVVCSTSTSSTYLTITSRGDGVGATIQQIIYAAAYAEKRGWNFGGITEPNYSHAVMKDVILQFLFGDYARILRKNRIGRLRLDRVGIHDMVSLQEFKTRENTVIEYADTKFDLEALGDLNTFITYEFLQSLRCRAYCGVAEIMRDSSLFSSNRSSVKVVAHIRRGDVLLNDTSRITSDETYFKIFAAIKRHNPNAEFHAFTSATQLSLVYTRMIANYAKHGVTLHVDSENYDDFENDYTATNAVKMVWAHLISADVLIASKSSFSTVPALFNSKCVLYQRFWHKSLESWTSLPINEVGRVANDKRKWNQAFTVQLQGCINRLNHNDVIDIADGMRCRICRHSS